MGEGAANWKQFRGSRRSRPSIPLQPTKNPPQLPGGFASFYRGQLYANFILHLNGAMTIFLIGHFDGKVPSKRRRELTPAHFTPIRFLSSETLFMQPFSSPALAIWRASVIRRLGLSASSPVACPVTSFW
jgi:hypothetical protein